MCNISLFWSNKNKPQLQIPYKNPILKGEWLERCQRRPLSAINSIFFPKLHNLHTLTIQTSGAIRWLVKQRDKMCRLCLHSGHTVYCTCWNSPLYTLHCVHMDSVQSPVLNLPEIKESSLIAKYLILTIRFTCFVDQTYLICVFSNKKNEIKNKNSS